MKKIEAIIRDKRYTRLQNSCIHSIADVLQRLIGYCGIVNYWYRLSLIIPTCVLFFLLILQTSYAAITVTRAELNGSELRLEGDGAVSGADLFVNGVFMDRADNRGEFKIRQGDFSSTTCEVTVSDLSTSDVAILSGCTPSDPPLPPPDLSVTISSPVEGATVRGTITISTTVEVSSLATVNFLVDSVPIGSDLVAPFGFDWETILFADGPHELTAIIDDRNGGLATSPPVTVTVDNASPPPQAGNSVWDNTIGSPGMDGPFVGGEVLALTVFDDGTGSALYAGGRFTSAGGVPVTHVARWDGTSWSAVGAIGDPALGSNVVRALAGFDDGSGPALYAGGFNNPAAADGVSRWDGTQWTVVGPGQLDIEVFALEVFDDGNGLALYAGGEFGADIRKWNPTTQTWEFLDGGILEAFSRVEALEVFDDGGGHDLYIGGSFIRAGTTVVNSLTRWDGASFSALDGGVENAVFALKTFDDDGDLNDELYVGGTFVRLSDGTPMGRIARWDGLGWSDVGGGLDPVGTGFNPVRVMEVFDDGSGTRLYVGGNITQAGGLPVNQIAAWDGLEWAQLGDGTGNGVDDISPGVKAMAVFDDGCGTSLFVSGDFTIAGGLPAKNIARWGPPCGVTPLPDVTIDSITANPPTIAVGTFSTLTWTTTGAASVTIDNDVGTGLAPDGNVDVSPFVSTTYTLTATGPGGAAIAMATVTVSPAPTVSILTPEDGATVVGTTRITPGINGVVDRVQLFVDGGLIADLTGFLSFFDWDTTTVANEHHTLTATAFDFLGNQVTSDPVNVTVNNGVAGPSILTLGVTGVPTSISRGSQFGAIATVTNTGGSTANGVSATVSWTPDNRLRLRSPQTPTQAFTPILPGGGSDSVSWSIRGEKEGTVTFTLTLTDSTGATVDIFIRTISIVK